jgi:cytochrome c peroxidase
VAGTKLPFLTLMGTVALGASLAGCEPDVQAQLDAQAPAPDAQMSTEAGPNAAAPDAAAPDAAAPDAAGPDTAAPDAAQGDAGNGDAAQEAGYAWDLPQGFPLPNVPADNPMTTEKVELGRHLFYDKRLSANGTQACASCHKQELAFSDGRATGLGSTGQAHPRGSMSLANIAYASTLTWANNVLHDLERQALVPMFGEDPVELGMSGMEDVLLQRLRAEPKYQELFPAAFPGEPDPFSVLNVTRAVASFQRSLLSGDAPFDRHARGDDSNFSESAKRGEVLFNSERFECFHCHGGFAFADSVNHAGKRTEEFFHNNALYNVDLEGGYPANNTGLFELTGNRNDMGRFKAPTLRNIALTAPYMHDGSILTLSEVLDHYAAGGRTIKDGPNAGVGFDNPFKSEFLHGANPPMTEQDRQDLLSFLESLTDQGFITNPKFANPWPDK